ncbi:addiction module protein [Albitalea terrae]|uniref:Addiction module protein n=2 Tax=Piscinibacter terrae TaxID=2496871 RepID=A0A3N7HWP8_9BURK|nr:addiction module protein [Albitalea terrae]
MNRHPEFAALFELPVAERLELVEDLWDSIADEIDAQPVPEAVVRELRERMARYDANPESGIPWEEVKRRLREEK